MEFKGPMMQHAPALLAALALTACGGGEAETGGAPGGDATTALEPTADNVPGTYRMSGSDEYVLEPDGTFTREEAGQTLSSGTWAIEGERIVLTYPEGDSAEGLSAGATRTVGLDSGGLVIQPDSDVPMRYPRR